VQEPTFKDARRFIALPGWESQQQYHNAARIRGLVNAMVKTSGGVENQQCALEKAAGV
jgi:hypothetical protein